MEPQKRAIRVDDAVWERFLAVPGKTLGDKLVSLLDGQNASKDTRIDEILELARDLPDREAIREIVEEVLQEKIEERQAQRATNPASIPGVTQGQYPPPPARRETSFERTQREAQERESRARARSNVGDDPAYSFDPEYVQE